MQLGMLGLGRMGANIVRRCMRGGHECVVWTRNAATVRIEPGGLPGDEPGGVPPYRHLDIRVQCQLVAPILGAFLPSFSLNSVEATASMPIDGETP